MITNKKGDLKDLMCVMQLKQETLLNMLKPNNLLFFDPNLYINYEKKDIRITWEITNLFVAHCKSRDIFPNKYFKFLEQK